MTNDSKVCFLYILFSLVYERLSEINPRLWFKRVNCFSVFYWNLSRHTS